MLIGILVVSDRCFSGEREDASGKYIKKFIINKFSDVKVFLEIVPDDKSLISDSLVKMVDQLQCSLVFTTGGTGLSQRDVTPEATGEVIDKYVPGICELIRMKSFSISPRSILSRAIAGSRGSSLIVNLPGSLKAVNECLLIIEPCLSHAVDVLQGNVNDCGV